MKLNFLAITICSLLFLFIGMVVGSKNVLPPSFYSINIFQVYSLIFTVIIGVFIAYFLNVRNSKLNKKREYIIKQCLELDFYLDDKSLNIYSSLENFSTGSERKSILLFFKTISSKIGIIKKLGIKECNCGIESISKICEDYKNKITGDEWGIKNSLDGVEIDAFKKDIILSRSTLQNIIADCLNN